jgi:hypothetical protein
MAIRTRPEYASARWLGEFLDLEPRTIGQMSRRGLFPSYRLTPKVVRYKVSEVVEALQVSGGGAA